MAAIFDFFVLKGNEIVPNQKFQYLQTTKNPKLAELITNHVSVQHKNVLLTNSICSSLQNWFSASIHHQFNWIYKFLSKYHLFPFYWPYKRRSSMSTHFSHKKLPSWLIRTSTKISSRALNKQQFKTLKNVLLFSIFCDFYHQYPQIKTTKYLRRSKRKTQKWKKKLAASFVCLSSSSLRTFFFSQSRGFFFRTKKKWNKKRA